MIWNPNECYIPFKESSQYLMSTLGIAQIDFYGRPELLPYQLVITQYLNKRLIELGTEDLRSLITELFDAFDEGADYIVRDLLSDEWASLVGIDIEAEEYKTDRFVFAWTNALSTLLLRLKFQYSGLFAQEDDGECCKCGARGQTYEEYEAWVSGVYPEDEDYDRTNYYRKNTAWGVQNIDKYCECYRNND